MDFRSVENLKSSKVNGVVENVSCGFVLHRKIKTFQRKQRWGVLHVEKISNAGKCIVKLFKQQNPKTPKLKLALELNSMNFCGVEKGEHYDRHGMRRYMCLITDCDYIIFEDAVVIVNGINHNVLGTWYQMIIETFSYVDKWRIVANDSQKKFLHVTSNQLSECYSLENKTKTPPKSLSLRMWQFSEIANLNEKLVQNEGTSLTTIKFDALLPNGQSECVSITVEGAPNLQNKVDFKSQKMNCQEQSKPSTSSSAPSFFIDSTDPNYSPNLVKLKHVKQVPKTDETAGTSRQMHKNEKDSCAAATGNLYVDLRNLKLNGSDREERDAELDSSSSEDEKSVKGPGLATTHVCYDSDYQTGESFSTVNSTINEATAVNPYINLQIRRQQALTATPPSVPPKTQNDVVVLNGDDNSTPHCSSAAPPPVPQRSTDLQQSTQCSLSDDPIFQSLAAGCLPSTSRDSASPYENNLSFELSIEEALSGSRESSGGVSERWFDLPYSTVVQIFLELEKDGVTVADWKALGEILGLTFGDIQQLVALMRVKSTIRPVEVVLHHWRRLHAPLPFTRRNFRKLLVDIGRQDLARLIPSDDDADDVKE